MKAHTSEDSHKEQMKGKTTKSDSLESFEIKVQAAKVKGQDYVETSKNIFESFGCEDEMFIYKNMPVYLFGKVPENKDQLVHTNKVNFPKG